MWGAQVCFVRQTEGLSRRVGQALPQVPQTPDFSLGFVPPPPHAMIDPTPALCSQLSSLGAASEESPRGGPSLLQPVAQPAATWPRLSGL